MPVTIGLIGAGVGMVGKAIGRAQANKQMKALLAEQPTYTENPLYAKQYALAQNMFNAQMPGTQTYLSQIERSRAAETATAERAGQNPLLASAAAAAQANEASGQLAGQQAAWKQQSYGALGSASQALAEEQQRVYADKLRQFQVRAQLEGAMQENRQNTWGDIANAGFGVATLGAQGAFGGAQTGLTSLGAAQNMSKIGLPQVNLPSSVGTIMPGAYNPRAVYNMSQIGLPSIGG